MAWKQIGNNAYYYQSRREGGRVISEYVGRGKLASLVDRLDTITRAQKKDSRVAKAKERESIEAEERSIADWFGRIEAVATGAMVAAGFRDHRGQWRRKREMKNDVEKKGQTRPIEGGSAEFMDLVIKANAGDKEAHEELRAIYASGNIPPSAEAYRETGGNPAWRLNYAIADMAGGASLGIKAASEAKLIELRRELEGPNPTPLERLLVERAVQCWFLANLYEARFLSEKRGTISGVVFHTRLIESAHKRFLSAVATLARVRKLALPSLQMNIAAQMNIGKQE